MIVWEHGFTAPCMRRFPLLIWSVWEHQNNMMRPPIEWGKPYHACLVHFQNLVSGIETIRLRNVSLAILPWTQPCLFLLALSCFSSNGNVLRKRLLGR